MDTGSAQVVQSRTPRWLQITVCLCVIVKSNQCELCTRKFVTVTKVLIQCLPVTCFFYSFVILVVSVIYYVHWRLQCVDKCWLLVGCNKEHLVSFLKFVTTIPKGFP